MLKVIAGLAGALRYLCHSARLRSAMSVAIVETGSISYIQSV